ncbi:MAG: energy transducer TonB [Gammaproteobacteria bacterium]|nr:energy transducer TonB [Gammaproteobacteria bacterium]NBY22632.1 energy transducer TonB [Gammaproteobacteria bacterium]
MPSRPPFFIALLIALGLHGVILWSIDFKREPPLLRRQDMTFELMPAPSPLAQKSAPKSLPSSPKLKTPSPPKKGEDKNALKAAPNPPLKEPPSPLKPIESQSEVPRPVLSRGLLSQQIAEVTSGMTREKTREVSQKKIVYTSKVKEHRAVVAAYEAAWHDKVERVGNLNFPEAARKEKLSGVLVMAVGIRPDGSLYSAQVQTSSGHEVLDQAAREIVKMAAPFAPLPPDILSEVDILVITRTWRFDGQDHLETRGAE